MTRNIRCEKKNYPFDCWVILSSPIHQEETYLNFCQKITEFVQFTLLFISCILLSYLSQIFNNMHHTLH